MARMVWGTSGERYYEAGVDRGVLFIDNLGVPWNGLKGISENPSGGSAKPFYIDGVKYLNVSAREEFEATLEAFSAPREFALCDGEMPVYAGLSITQQPRKMFSLSYRTKIGNDVDAIDHAYKIHIVYNALVAPSQRSRETLGDNTDPLTLSWSLTTTPPALSGFKPTAHLIIDSRTIPDRLLKAIEDLLYGTEATIPYLPGPQELVDLTQNPPVVSINQALKPYPNDTLGWTGTSIVTVDIDSVFVRRVGTNSKHSERVSSSLDDLLVSWRNVGGLGSTVVPEEMISVTAGEYYSFGIYWASSLANCRVQFFIRFYDESGTQISSDFQTEQDTANPVNTWELAKYEQVLAPVGATRAFVGFNVYVPSGDPYVVGGEETWIQDLMVNSGVSLRPYIDGNIPDTAQYIYSWEDEAFASPSKLATWY